MQYICHYSSPLGGVLMSADEIGILGLWFEGQKHFAQGLSPCHEKKNLPIFDKAKAWLDIYFLGRQPTIEVPLHIMGTAFQKEVWTLLLAIPYGTTKTYGSIARRLSDTYGKPMSAQAVGRAVGSNPISIIVPCHRVVGADGHLTGYAAGLDKKAELLRLEKICLDNSISPRNKLLL